MKKLLLILALGFASTTSKAEASEHPRDRELGMRAERGHEVDHRVAENWR